MSAAKFLKGTARSHRLMAVGVTGLAAAISITGSIITEPTLFSAVIWPLLAVCWAWLAHNYRVYWTEALGCDDAGGDEEEV